jgi:hypothetical protein
VDHVGSVLGGGGGWRPAAAALYRPLIGAPADGCAGGERALSAGALYKGPEIVS